MPQMPLLLLRAFAFSLSGRFSIQLKYKAPRTWSEVTRNRHSVAGNQNLQNDVFSDIAVYSFPNTRPEEFSGPTTKSPPRALFSAGSAPNRRSRYSASPLVSLLFCLIGTSDGTSRRGIP